MRTIFIYDQCCQDDIKFFVLDGDYSHLNKIYINEESDTDEEEKKQDELLALLFDANNELKPEMLSLFPEMDFGDKVIIIGFYP